METDDEKDINLDEEINENIEEDYGGKFHERDSHQENNIVDEVKSILSGLLKPTTKENVVGEAEVRNVFKITGAGKVAGCYVTSGEIRRNLNIKLIRDGIVIFDGKIKTLKRFKDDVKEVKNNYECGIAIENYDDIKEKDIIECYEVVEEKRSLWFDYY